MRYCEAFRLRPIVGDVASVYFNKNKKGTNLELRLLISCKVQFEMLLEMAETL